jgi:hypothetical protein
VIIVMMEKNAVPNAMDMAGNGLGAEKKNIKKK